MGRKVFISVLGSNNYTECIYYKNEYKSAPVRFVQEATLDYLTKLEEWTENDVTIFLLTDEVEKINWLDNGHLKRDTNEIIQCEGLKRRLEKMNLPIQISTINHLPHGNNETEIWNIFENTFSKLQDEDELYFDLTHGFRYLPMLVMVLINYSKFLKNTKVKSITYGNFESRNRITNEAPIIDLLLLSTLQDWTYAAGQFLDSGNVNKLINLSTDKIAPILRDTKGKDEGAKILRKFIDSLEKSVEDMQACRGVSVVEATNLGALKQITNQLESTFIQPLNPIFGKIKSQFEDFSEHANVKNGFIAAKWCLENGLYQQSITIFLENVVTLFCKEEGLDYKGKERELINKAFKIHEKNLDEDKWLFSSDISEEELLTSKSVIKRLLLNEKLKRLSHSFDVCTNIRNDINHSGMRNDPHKPKTIKDKIEKIITETINILYES